MSEAPLVPESLVHAAPMERITWLLQDSQSDDLMAGTPRYQPRYTEREQQILHLLRWVLDLPEAQQ